MNQDKAHSTHFPLPPDWTVDDGHAYRDERSGAFRFPFVALDPLPGGRNLGRIEWHVELVPARKRRGEGRRIGALAIWAKQTRDDGYVRRLFLLSTYCEALTAYASGTRDDFIRHVWRVQYCALHDQPIFSAYPQDHHQALVVELGSSVSAELYFEPREGAHEPDPDLYQ